jgi:hypothetical protein
LLTISPSRPCRVTGIDLTKLSVFENYRARTEYAFIGDPDKVGDTAIRSEQRATADPGKSCDDSVLADETVILDDRAMPYARSAPDEDVIADSRHVLQGGVILYECVFTHSHIPDRERPAADIGGAPVAGRRNHVMEPSAYAITPRWRDRYECKVTFGRVAAANVLKRH